MLRRRFDRFVTSEDKNRYHHLFVGVMQHDEREMCDLALQRGDGSTLQAQLDCVRVWRRARHRRCVWPSPTSPVASKPRRSCASRPLRSSLRKACFVDGRRRAHDPANQPGLHRNHRLHGGRGRGKHSASIPIGSPGCRVLRRDVAGNFPHRRVARRNLEPAQGRDGVPGVAHHHLREGSWWGGHSLCRHAH